MTTLNKIVPDPNSTSKVFAWRRKYGGKKDEFPELYVIWSLVLVFCCLNCEMMGFTWHKPIIRWIGL